MDTLRATHAFVRWLREHPLLPAALFAFLNPSLDENLARLRQRRAARGIVENELPAKTFWHVFAFRSRAKSVWEYAQKNYKREPVRFVELPEKTTDEAAKRVLNVLKEIQQGCDGATPDSIAAVD